MLEKPIDNMLAINIYISKALGIYLEKLYNKRMNRLVNKGQNYDWGRVG